MGAAGNTFNDASQKAGAAANKTAAIHHGIVTADAGKIHKYLRCCNITNGCCLVLAPFLTVPLVVFTLDISAVVSFSTWVCLLYGFCFGLLFLAYEFRRRERFLCWTAGLRSDGSKKSWDDWLNEQYGFMQYFHVRTAFLIVLGFFMGGAGPLGWVTAAFCFLHGVFNLYVYCTNKDIQAEIRSGDFNAAVANDVFDKAAGAGDYAATHTKEIKQGAGYAYENRDKVEAAGTYAYNNQDQVKQLAAVAEKNPELARGVVGMAQSNPQMAQAALGAASASTAI